MGKKSLRRYFYRSIRFRILASLLFSVAAGLVLGYLTHDGLARLIKLPIEPTTRFGVLFFLAFFYMTLIFISLISFMLAPISFLATRLRQIKSKKDAELINPSEYGELAPLVETLVDHFEWAENQQQLSAMIHHAFRRRVERLAEYDALTGLYNRHYLEVVLPLQLSYISDLKDQLSVIMLDVDHFKHYNDTNGHLEGDRVLKQVAQLLRSKVRDQDICCRYGGEEFLVVLPNASLERAVAIAERIRVAIEQSPFPFEERQPGGRLTASLGVANFPGDATTPEKLIECADQAMYLAKKRGRNRTCSYAEVVSNGDAEIRTIEPAS